LVSAGHVINAKPNAVIVPEIELHKIPMQMLLFAVLISAAHSAFENREVAFNGVGVNITTHVFA